MKKSLQSIAEGAGVEPLASSAAVPGSNLEFVVLVDAARKLISATPGWYEIFRGWWDWPNGAPIEEASIRPGAEAAWAAWQNFLQRSLDGAGSFGATVTWVGPRGAQKHLILRFRTLRDAVDQVIGGAVQGEALRGSAPGKRPADRVHVILRDEVAPSEPGTEAVPDPRESLLALSSDGVVTLDSGGTVLSVNNAGGPGLPVTAGRPLWEFAAGQQRESLQHAIADVLATGIPATVECRIALGPERWFVLRFLRLHSGGDDKVLAAIFTETTAHHSLEEQLRRAQRLSAQGMLAAMTAHEIKNYLSIALGHAQLLREREPALADALAPIIRAVETAGHLDRQLFQIAQPNAQSAACVFDVAAAARATCDLLEPLLRRRVKLEPVDGPIIAYADPSNFEQALVNLLLNARDATSDYDGEIVVRVGIAPEAKGSGHSRFLEVSDNGVSISPAAQRRLFESYFTTKPKGRGTGLGLANVRKMVREAGGELEFQSESGRGTTVRIVLPPPPADVKE